MKTRIATSEEVEKLYNYIANSHWESSVLYANTIGYDDVKKGYDTVVNEIILDLKKNIGGIIIAKVYNEALIEFTYNYSYCSDDLRELNSFTSRYVYAYGNFLDSTPWDVFNIEEVLSELKEISDYVKLGRPNRPTDKAILSTYKAYNLIKEGFNVNEACSKSDIAKSTYYRVKRYIENSSPVLKKNGMC
jgi:hypothetical protein